MLDHMVCDGLSDAYHDTQGGSCAAAGARHRRLSRDAFASVAPAALQQRDRSPERLKVSACWVDDLRVGCAAIWIGGGEAAAMVVEHPV